MASAPGVPFRVGLLTPQLAAHWVSGLPTKEYLMSLPPMVAWSCQPQYWVQKPEVAVTVLSVRTKYTALASDGSAPEVIALETIDWILKSTDRF